MWDRYRTAGKFVRALRNAMKEATGFDEGVYGVEEPGEVKEATGYDEDETV